MLPCFGNWVAGWPSRMLQSWAHTEIFQKTGFSCFSRLMLATCSRVEGPVARGIQRFSRFSSRLPREWNFLLRKTLKFFLKNLVLKVFCYSPWWLAGDLTQSQKSRVFAKTGLLFKSFWVSLELFSIFIVFLISSLSHTHRALNPNLHSWSSLQPDSPRKGYGFYFLTLFCMFISAFFYFVRFCWVCVFCNVRS